MAPFIKWALTIAAVTAGGFVAKDMIQRGRRSVRQGLREAESVVDHTRQAVEQVGKSIHKARTVI